MDRKEAFDRTLRFRPGKVAMLVVDMQEGFLAPGAAMEVSPGQNIIKTIVHLATTCRQAGVPVIYIRFIYSPAIPTLVGELHIEHKPTQPGIEPGFARPSSCCLEGDRSVEIVPDLKPESRELVIDKHGYDAFHQTPLCDAAISARPGPRAIPTQQHCSGDGGPMLDAV